MVGLFHLFMVKYAGEAVFACHRRSLGAVSGRKKNHNLKQKPRKCPAGVRGPGRKENCRSRDDARPAMRCTHPWCWPMGACMHGMAGPHLVVAHKDADYRTKRRNDFPYI